MSTRCTTHFQREGKTEAIVYKHTDGYPDTDDGMVKTLEIFFSTVEQQTSDTRFSDPSYLAAKFVVFLAREYARDEGKPLAFVSVGVMMRDAGDIEYRYAVHCDERDILGRPVVTWEATR